jgi:hypothetical protein
VWVSIELVLITSCGSDVAGSQPESGFGIDKRCGGRILQNLSFT